MDTSLIIAILSPILISIGGITSWLVKARREELVALEEKAREHKLEVYETILEPFIAVFTFTLKEKEQQKYINKFQTIEYKKAAFNLITFGSDETIRTFNKIMQDFFNPPENFLNDEEYAKHHLKNISNMLLEIRRDLYRRNSTIKRSETIEFMITDIEKHREFLDN